MSGRNPNPHFWLDPQFALIYVERIADALSAADPNGADTYRINTERYLVHDQATIAGIAE